MNVLCVLQVICTSVVLCVSIAVCGVSLALLSRQTQDYQTLERGLRSDSDEDLIPACDTQTQNATEQPSTAGSINAGTTDTASDSRTVTLLLK